MTPKDGISPQAHYRIEYKRMKRGLKITWGNPAQSAQVSFIQWEELRRHRTTGHGESTWYLSRTDAFVTRGWMASSSLSRYTSYILTELGMAIRDSIPAPPAQKDRPDPLKVRKSRKLPEVTTACLKVLQSPDQWHKGMAIPLGGTEPEEALWGGDRGVSPQMRTLYANGLVEPGVSGPEWVAEEGRHVPTGRTRLVWRKTPQAILAGY